MTPSVFGIRLLFISLSLGILLLPTKAVSKDFSHELWAQTLKGYLADDDRIRYGKLKKDAQSSSHSLPRYLHQLAKVETSDFYSWPTASQVAFLINAYNAHMVKLIVDNYPIQSIKQIGGIFSSPWTRKFFNLLNGKITHLRALEESFLIDLAKNPLVHLALYRGSLSSPSLAKIPYSGDMLDAQLKQATTLFLQTESKNDFTQYPRVAYISAVFDWFSEAFPSTPGVLNKHILEHHTGLSKVNPDVSPIILFEHFDWDLNDV